PGPKFDYKLRWLGRLQAHAAELVARPEPVVLAGDYNVIPEGLDVYWPESWVRDALFRPESREAYRRLLAQGWSAARRHLNPSRAHRPSSPQETYATFTARGVLEKTSRIRAYRSSRAFFAAALSAFFGSARNA